MSTFWIRPDPHPSRQLALDCVRMAPEGSVVSVGQETRTQEQNRLLWPILALWERNQKIIINGRETFTSRDTWKTILLAAYRKNHGAKPDFAIGLDGELVTLGYSTKVMAKVDFADFLTYILAESAQRGMELPSQDEPMGYTRESD